MGDTSTPASAVAVTLFESGKVDLDRIAELLKTTPEEAAKRIVADGVAFEDPRGGWETAENYLSGNVRKKLLEAREAAQVDERYAPNVPALEKVQPEDVPMEMISVKLGAGWVPTQDIQQFSADLMQGKPENFRVHYVESSGTWLVDWDKGSGGMPSSSLAREVYGTSRAGFMDVLEAALNDRPIKIYDRTRDESVLNREETDKANAKVQEVRDQFQDWLWADDKRAKRLHRYYNDNFKIS